MKSFVCFFALLAVTSALPTIDNNSGILRLDNVLTPDGSFAFGYETSGGIREEVHGEQKEISGARGTVVTGSYSYVYDGMTYTVTYTADENGFQPIGAHFPKEVVSLPVPPVELPVAPTLPPLPETPTTQTLSEVPALPRV